MKRHFDTEEGMAHEIQITKTGSPDVMQLREVSRSKLAPGDAWIGQESIGVNYLDVMQRSGAVPIPIPGGIGLEAAGRVLEVGPDVTNVKVGDRVAQHPPAAVVTRSISLLCHSPGPALPQTSFR